MRVAQFVGPATGGIGVHVDTLMRDLRRAGVDVVPITAPLTAHTFGWDDAVVCWPQSPRDIVRLRAALRSVDVVHAHGLRAGALASLLAGRVVVSLHNEPPDSGAIQARAMMRLVARRAILVTGASNDLVEWASRCGATAELAMVPSPLVPDLLRLPAAARGATAAWKTLAAAENLDSTQPLVLTVARIAPQKRIPDVVTVARELSGLAHVVLIGAADAALATQLGDLAPVTYLGPRRDLLTWYRAASVVLVTSSWEARALVVQEAMAAGVPVVATDTGGLPDLVVTGSTGYLCPVGDTAQLAAAVARLVRDPEQAAQLGQAARQVAGTWPNTQETVALWLKRYGRAIG